MKQAAKQEKKSGINTILRSQKLRQIDALYRNQIKEIYAQSKSKVEKQETEPSKSSTLQFERYDAKPSKKQVAKLSSPNTKSESTLNVGESVKTSNLFGSCSDQDEKVRASVFLKGTSTKTIEHLRKDNQSKQLKIRELAYKCQVLVQKLKNHLSPDDLQKQIQSLQEYSDGKMQRLENLFKIKSQQIFFKTKLQTVNLLQQFGVPKQELTEINDISNENTLYSFMVKKLKSRLKDFRNKEQQSTFQIQKDKVLSQKQQERIHYLGQTNQLLRLSEKKLKEKNQDLKNQMNDFLQKLREKQRIIQELQSQNFKLKKINDDLNANNIRLITAFKGVQSEKLDEKRTWQAKEKEMKTLLNNYFLEKKKLQAQIEESQGRTEEIIINRKFLEQENERLNRQLIRWKERYQWLQKDSQIKIKQLQEEFNTLISTFQDYKQQHNQGLLIDHRNQVEEALRKVEYYQREYESVVCELQEEKKLLTRAEQQFQEKMDKFQREWISKIKMLEKIKEQQIYQLHIEHETRQQYIRSDYQKKQRMIAEEMQARMKTLLAQKDKKVTEQLVLLEQQNDHLGKQISNLKQLLRAKQSFINSIRHHNK